jgi:predicted nucleic-acid-binding protein
VLGLDANVMARLVLADDARQTQQALAALEAAQAAGEMLVLSLPTVLELEWVLRSLARLDKARVLRVLRGLLEVPALHIEHEQVLEQALYAYDQNRADFAECLFAAHYQRMGCRSMLTFDTKAARLDGVDLLD